MAALELQSELLDLLDDAFLATHWRARPPRVAVQRSGPSPGSAWPLDLVADRVYLDPLGQTLGVALASEEGPARSARLKDRLSTAFLRAHEWSRDEVLRGLALVGAPRLTRGMVEALAAWADPHAKRLGVSWGVLDLSGLRALEGPDLGQVRETGLARRTPVAGKKQRSSPPTAFTDLGQWLLKVALADRLPQGWIHIPERDSRLDQEGVTAFALRADVAPSTVSQWLKAMRAHGYVDRDDLERGIQRVPELLQAWRHALVARPPVERPTAFMFSGRGSARERVVSILRQHAGKIDGAGKSHRQCFGLYSAAAELGIDHARGVPEYVYAHDVSDAVLTRLGLRPVEAGARPDVVVRLASFPESVFRASPIGKSGVHVSDALQCWLDLQSQPGVGKSTAREIEGGATLWNPEP